MYIILGYIIRREDVVHIIAVTNVGDFKHLKNTSKLQLSAFLKEFPKIKPIYFIFQTLTEC